MIRQHRVTTLWMTVGLFNAVIDSRPETLAGVEEILTGGDALSPRHIRRAQEYLGPGTCIINGYGPTECTTFACCHRIPYQPGLHGASIPIGRPIANTRAYVLNGEGEPVPVGVTGELHLAGPGVARGYLTRPDLSAERFVGDRFCVEPGGRMYRTGDLVRWRSDGLLEFVGRLDRQVKIRGFRIELGEIERVMEEHPAVEEVVVEACSQPDGGKAIAAYWKRKGPADLPSLEPFARERLPSYMVPSVWVELATIPRTSAGKFDRRALPEVVVPVQSPVGAEGSGTLYEALLAKIFAGLLARPTVGLDDDFFVSGGHSLLALRLIEHIEREFGVRLPTRVLFQEATVRSLARRIEAIRRQHPEGLVFPGTEPLVTLQEGDGRPTLFLFPGGFGDESEFLTHAWICRHHLGAGFSMKAFRNRAWRGAGPLRGSIRGMARDCIGDMRRVQAAGPWHLAGLCVGGGLAFEVALQLQEAGEEVGMLVLADTLQPERTTFLRRCLSEPVCSPRQWVANTLYLGMPWLRSWMTSGGRRLLLHRWFKDSGGPSPEAGSPKTLQIERDRYLHTEWCHYQEGEGYLRRLMVPPRGVFRGRLDLVLSTVLENHPSMSRWAGHASEGVERHVLPGSHSTYLIEGGGRLAELYRRINPATRGSCSRWDA